MNKEYQRSDLEVMAPAGSYESLMAAIQGGADSVYFGVEGLNMRARSSNNFTTDDLRRIASTCADHGVKSYLTVNTVLYDADLDTMRRIIDASLEAGVSAVIAADVFFDYISAATGQKNPVIVCGTDTRPTGGAVASAIVRTLLARKAIVRYPGVVAAPEIMAYARKFDGFIYISASHNPIGHNGLKVGLSDGGVVNAEENAKMVKAFVEKCADPEAMKRSSQRIDSISRWFVGSSRSKTSGRCRRIFASSIRIRQPPENSAVGRSKSERSKPKPRSVFSILASMLPVLCIRSWSER